MFLVRFFRKNTRNLLALETGLRADVTVWVFFSLPLLQVRLSDDDVERERSIVVEEWRQGRGCAQRATEDFFKLVVKGR